MKMRLVRMLAVLAIAMLPTAAAHAAKVTLKFAFPVSPRSPLYTWDIGPWIHQVEKASQGELEIKFFPGSSLATLRNSLDRVEDNVAQITYGVQGPFGNIFQKSSVTQIPFLSENDEDMSVALWRLYKKGLLDKAYDRVHPLALFVFPPSGFHTQVPVRSIRDLKGMKVAAFSREAGEYAELLGATPITITPTEVYDSMQRGMVNGIMIGWSAILAFKFNEITHYHLTVPLGAAPAFILMNAHVYDQLPQKAKHAIDEYSGEVFSRRMGKNTDRQTALGKHVVCKQKGQHCFRLTPEQIAIWKKRLAPAEAAWIKRIPNGAEILATFRKELMKIHDGR